MSLFFESIKLQHGIPKHLSYHQSRVDHTYLNFWGIKPALQLHDLIARQSHLSKAELAKLKIIYGQEGVMSISSSGYIPREPKSLHLLEIGPADEYDYKSTDRRWIEQYSEHLPGQALPLFVRDGLVLESSYTNVALKKGDQWYTPSNPLHRGTTRARFLDTGHLIADQIPVHNLKDFEELRLFNAILGWGLGHRFLYSELVFER